MWETSMFQTTGLVFFANSVRKLSYFSPFNILSLNKTLKQLNNNVPPLSNPSIFPLKCKVTWAFYLNSDEKVGGKNPIKMCIHKLKTTE